MATMSLALGTKAALVSAGGLPKSRALGGSGRSAVVHGSGPVAPLRNVARDGRSALRLQQPERLVAVPELKRSFIVAAKADGQLDSTELQEKAEDLLKQVKATWEKVDDKLAVGGLGLAGLIVLWGSFGLISAIEKLPVIPQLLEIVGLLFTGFFVYRYLLFKPDREELFKLVDDAKSKITGQDNL